MHGERERENILGKRFSLLLFVCFSIPGVSLSQVKFEANSWSRQSLFASYKEKGSTSFYTTTLTAIHNNNNEDTSTSTSISCMYILQQSVEHPRIDRIEFEQNL